MHWVWCQCISQWCLCWRCHGDKSRYRWIFRGKHAKYTNNFLRSMRVAYMLVWIERRTKSLKKKKKRKCVKGKSPSPHAPATKLFTGTRREFNKLIIMNWQKKRRNKSFNSLEPIQTPGCIFFCDPPSRKTNFLRESLFIFHSMWQKDFFFIYFTAPHLCITRGEILYTEALKKQKTLDSTKRAQYASQTSRKKKNRFVQYSVASDVTKRKGLTTPTHAELGNRVTQTFFSRVAVTYTQLSNNYTVEFN